VPKGLSIRAVTTAASTLGRSALSLAAVPGPAWWMAGVGDFNGDGWPDIPWRHPLLGLNLVVYMQGPTAVGLASLPTLGASWQLTGVADLNGDGKPDLVWRRTTDGSNQVWFLDGVVVTGASPLPSTVDLNSRIAALVDLNGDGKPDLVWRNLATGAD